MEKFVTYASNRGDFAGRMKRWEQCYCGPEPKSYNNFEAWENLFKEDTKTKFFKTDKTKKLREVKLSKLGNQVKQCLSSAKGNKVGIFVGLLVLGATAILGSNNSLNAKA